MRAAWRCKYLKLSRFVDPTVIPGVDESPELTRTALMSRWLMSDSCESMMKKEELEEFFYDDAVIPSIAIFSYEPAPPRIWDSLHQDTRSLNFHKEEKVM